MLTTAVENEFEMVEKVTKSYHEIRIGSISISTDDIIEIIDTKKFSNISAENKDFRFSGLDDLRLHKSLLSGFPTINCDEIAIMFSSYNPTIRANIYKNKDSSTIAESIKNEISKHKSFLDRLNDRYKQRHILLFLLILLIPSIMKRYDSNYASRDIIEIADSTSAIFLSITLAYVTWKFYADTFRKKVFEKGREGFFRRNIERITMIIIGSIITIILSQIGKSFFGFN